jgi:hypothetical protein
MFEQIGLTELIYGPMSPSLSAIDRAILIEQELAEMVTMKTEQLVTLEEDLEEAREQAAAAEALQKALDEVIVAYDVVRAEKDDTAMVGSLIIPGAKLEAAGRDLDRAIANARQVTKQYEAGEL